MLLFQLGATALRGSFFGNLSEPVLVGNVQCTGFERNLTDCRSDVWSEGNCTGSNSAGVICLGISVAF